MKLILITAIVLLTGCSSKMAVSTWNMTMAGIAPGSYYTAYNSGLQIKQEISNAFND